MSNIRVLQPVRERYFKAVYIHALTKLERSVNRRLAHPQSMHLTEEELGELSDLDQKAIKRAQERRERC